MNKIINFLAENKDNNLRIDTFINNKEKSLSRTRIKNLILKEKLRLNDKILKSPSKRVNTGDRLSLQIPEPVEASLKPFNFKCFSIVTFLNNFLKFLLIIFLLLEKRILVTFSKFDIFLIL